MCVGVDVRMVTYIDVLPIVPYYTAYVACAVRAPSSVASQSRLPVRPVHVCQWRFA